MQIKDIGSSVCLCLDKRISVWLRKLKPYNYGLKISSFVCGGQSYPITYNYIDKPYLPPLNNSYECWRRIFIQLKKYNVKLALLLEDDFYFTNDFLDGLSIIDKDSFDICTLGSFSSVMKENDIGFKVVKPLKNEGFAGFHGILVKHNVFDDIINYRYDTNVSKAIDTVVGHPNSEIFNKHEIKMLSPSIILQEPLKSQIVGEHPQSHSGLMLAWNAAIKNNRISLYEK